MHTEMKNEAFRLSCTSLVPYLSAIIRYWKVCVIDHVWTSKRPLHYRIGENTDQICKRISITLANIIVDELH